MKYVRDIKTPVLILHGEEDDNTFIANSLEMYTALKKLGRTVEFVRYPREGHGFEEPVHQADALRRSLSWINRHVFTGGERPPRLGGEEIEQGLWRLKVLSAETVPGYSGIEAGGKFLEIRFLLESRGCDTPPWDIAPEKDVSFILPGGTAYPPAGIVVESPGDFTLLRGRNITVSSVGREGGSRALALRLAFDIPKDLRRGTLRVKDMPPVEIEISIIDKHP